MSLLAPATRKQRCTVTTRGAGAGCSPKKTGTNCSIPAIVKSVVDISCGTNVAGGSSLCCFPTKKSIHACLSSWLFTLLLYDALRTKAAPRDMTLRNRSSLRHPGSAPAAPPPRSRHPWLRSAGRELPQRHVAPRDRNGSGASRRAGDTSGSEASCRPGRAAGCFELLRENGAKFL